MSTVSVVIPTFERPDFLRGAIETALNQTHENLEVVVVDDGSSSSYAAEIVKEHPDLVRHITHTENRGLSAARNTGVKESTGDYIAFLDDDDRWHRTKISRQVSALEKDGEAGLATCLVTSISPENQIIHCETSTPSGDCSDELLVGNYIGTPSRILVRRTCFTDVGGFDESLTTKQDWDFYLRACQDWRVAAVEDHLCFRTVHESMSSSPKIAERDNKVILEKHEELIRERSLLDKARAEVAERVGSGHLKAGNMKKARKYLKTSFSLSPTKRRGLMLSVAFTHPKLVETLILIKRGLSLRINGCSNLEVTPEAVPGLNS